MVQLHLLPLCFSEYGTQIVHSVTCQPSLRPLGSSVRCGYRTQVKGKPYLMTVTWCKSVGGAGLTLQVRELKSKEYEEEEEEEERWRKGGGGGKWVFGGKSRKGRRELRWEGASAVWDMTEARYEGEEAKERFYFAVYVEAEVVLSLGDREAAEMAAAAAEMRLIWRTEETFGRRLFAFRGSRLSSSGLQHNISIECNWRAAEPRLAVRIDGRTVVCVKKLRWKFRGNQTVLVDGCAVELFWDVHDWLFGGAANSAAAAAVFLFQSTSTCNGCSERSFSSVASTSTSLLQWRCPSSSSSSSVNGIYKESSANPGFSLILYAWRV